MTTTIKTLSDGRTLTTDGTDLYLDDTNVGPAQLTLLQNRVNGMVSFARTSATTEPRPCPAHAGRGAT